MVRKAVFIDKLKAFDKLDGITMGSRVRLINALNLS